MSCLLVISYRLYLISQGYEYGLANFNMQLYMTMADQTKNIEICETFDAMENDYTFLHTNPLPDMGISFFRLFPEIFRF